MEDEHHHHTLEPAVLERQFLRAALLQPDADGNFLPCDREHLRGHVDSPDAGGGVFGEPRRERAGAAADVEYAAPTQVACTNEEFEDLRAQFGSA